MEDFDLFIRRWFHMRRLFGPICSSSLPPFVPREGLCFVMVAFPGYTLCKKDNCREYLAFVLEEIVFFSFFVSMG